MTKELIGKLRELSDRVFHGDTKPGDFRIIDRAADALAAVPDAATEGLRAERDAALAVVGRCRGVLASWRSVQAGNREHFESGNPGMIVPIDCVGGLSAALDGAPEPEVKP